MAKRCELCGKTAQYGNNVSHSKRHTKRRWEVNVHPATLNIAGKASKVKICTRCLRTQNKSAT